MEGALKEYYEEGEAQRPLGIHELKRRMRLEGKVTRIELFGAFVDVGSDVDGLVHISQLSSRRVNRVTEVVNEGDQVIVWVVGVDPAKNRIDLTMIEPPAVDLDDIRAGQVYTGKVKRLERFGAFVDIGATRDGLVHVSEITSDYIRDPKEYVKPGDEVQVKVLKVDHERRRIELSMKALEEHLAADEEEDETEEPPTALELAWREAQEGHETPSKHERRRKTRIRRDEDDIFARTLRLRGDQD